MTKLRVPSVQHLARHWYDSPNKIEDEFVKMAMNPPFFNYNALVTTQPDFTGVSFFLQKESAQHHQTYHTMH